MKTPVSQIKKNLYSMDQADFQKWLVENLDNLIKYESKIIQNECVMFGAQVFFNKLGESSNKIPEKIYSQVEEFYSKKYIK